MGDDE